MPRTTTPVIAAEALAATDQPNLIVDEELQLRPWAAGDAAQLRLIYADPSIVRWHARTLESQAEATELAMGWRQGWATETEASWAVASESDRIVGRVALKHLNLHEAVAELAYWIAPEARGGPPHCTRKLRYPIGRKITDQPRRWRRGRGSAHS